MAALGRNKSTWRRALTLHQWLLTKGHAPDDRLCTTLIRVCSQHSQAQTALELYEWMRAAKARGGAGQTPTVFTYTAAMRAALTGNLVDRALKVRLRAAVLMVSVLPKLSYLHGQWWQTALSALAPRCQTLYQLEWSTCHC